MDGVKRFFVWCRKNPMNVILGTLGFFGLLAIVIGVVGFAISGPDGAPWIMSAVLVLFLVFGLSLPVLTVVQIYAQNKVILAYAPSEKIIELGKKNLVSDVADEFWKDPGYAYYRFVMPEEAGRNFPLSLVYTKEVAGSQLVITADYTLRHYLRKSNIAEYQLLFDLINPTADELEDPIYLGVWLEDQLTEYLDSLTAQFIGRDSSWDQVERYAKSLKAALAQSWPLAGHEWVEFVSGDVSVDLTKPVVLS